MSAHTFEIVFFGALVQGADPAAVRRNLAALFKTDAAKVEPLFSGKRFSLRKGLEQAEALRYQRALREAGAIVEIVDASAPTSAPTAPAGAGSASEPADEGGLKAVVDPPGVILIEAQKVEPLQVDTSHLKLDAPGVVLVEHPAVPALQVDVSALSMAEPGVVLVQPEPVAERRIETGGLTLDRPGVVLVEPEKIEAPVIDTSGLSVFPIETHR